MIVLVLVFRKKKFVIWWSLILEENVIDNSINFAKVQGRFYLTGTDFTKTSELVKLSVLTSPKIYTSHFQFSLYSTSLNSYDSIKVKKAYLMHVWYHICKLIYKLDLILLDLSVVVSYLIGFKNGCKVCGKTKNTG